jgi:DNA polymerase-3 subunit delta'
MPFTDLLNHQSAIERFQRSVKNGRLASTYLFLGKEGIGKRTFAMKLAEALLCERPVGVLQACGICSACQQVQAQSHPDLILVSKPADKSIIPLELFIGGDEHRRQEGLIHDLGLKPFRGGRKIAIIDDADFMNQEGANSLLKTLEEPPAHSLLILIGTSEQRQLKTIVSRSQIVRFQPLSEDQVSCLLQQINLESTVPENQLAKTAEGSISRALKLADPELFEFRVKLLDQLSSGDPGKAGFVKTMQIFVEAAGTEGALKRDRLHFLADLAISFFRYCYLQIAGVVERPLGDDATLRYSSILMAGLSNMPILNALEICADMIDRTVDLQFQVYANVSAVNAIDAWLIQLGRIYRGRA